MKPLGRRFIIGVVAGVVVFAGFSLYADIGSLRDRLGGFTWAAFAAALGLAAVNYALRFVRWSLYLRSRNLKVPLRTSALTFLSGFALSVTPGKVGELLKSFLLRDTLAIPVLKTAPIVVAERVTDMLALLILALGGVALYGISIGTVLLAAGVIALLFVALSWPALAHWAIRLVSRLGPLHRFSDRLREFYDGLAEMVRPSKLSWATGLGVIAWLAECVGFAMVVAGFPGTTVPIGLATTIYATTSIAGALSFLPGGLLVTEAAMTLFLVESGHGVDQATAVAATILTRLATLWFAVLLGVMALALFRRLVPAVDFRYAANPAD